MIEANPVIVAVKNMEDLELCCQRDEIRVVFILFGDICNICKIVQQVKDANKVAMVHVDLISGLLGKEVAVDFIHSTTVADGIISTKPTLIKRGRELGLQTILRVFLLDSMSYENLKRQVETAKPDMLEILPGLMPKIIRKVCNSVRIPVIASGLIVDKDDVMDALSAGSVAVSSTNHKVWFM